MRKTKALKLFVENLDNIIALSSDAKAAVYKQDWDLAMELLNSIGDEMNEAVEIAEKKI